MDDRSGQLVPAQDAVTLEQALDATLARTWNAEEIAGRHHRSWENVSDDLFKVLLWVSKLISV